MEGGSTLTQFNNLKRFQVEGQDLLLLFLTRTGHLKLLIDSVTGVLGESNYGVFTGPL